MTSDALQALLPRRRDSGAQRSRQTPGARDAVRIGTTALRGIAVLTAVLGGAGGILFALVFLCLTAAVMLGLLGGAFLALPMLHAFAGR